MEKPKILFHVVYNFLVWLNEELIKCSGDHEVRCVRRKDLLEALAKELPSGTIRYSSKVVSIEDSGLSKLVHLADGSILETKVPSSSTFVTILDREIIIFTYTTFICNIPG